MPPEDSPIPIAPLRAVRQSSRVILSEGEALVRAGLRALLEEDGTVIVVGEAATGEEALDLASQLKPDVVLLDAGLPGLDSVETTRRLLADTGVPVMLLANSEADEHTFAALRAGASGVVLKDTEPSELVRAVAVLARGDALLSPSFTRRLIADFASRPEPSQPNDERVAVLTAREREVVGLVAMGLSNGEIAEELVLSPATARTHVSRAMVKLGARDRSQLVVFAYNNGLVLQPAAGA